jgi:hypothetical protein
VPQQEKIAFSKSPPQKKTITFAPLFTKLSNTFMKIKFFLVALAICTFVSVPAQAQDEDTRHEVSVSYGGIPNSIWIDAFTDIVPAMFGEKHETKHRIGPVGLEYYYHTSPLIGVGAVAVFATSKQDCLYKDTKTSVITKSFYTVMPSIKFNWLRKEHWGLYSKVAAGATYARFNDEDCDDNGKKTGENAVSKDLLFNFQASLIGVEAGSAHLRGFAEFGVGEQGMALAGLRFKF